MNKLILTSIAALGLVSTSALAQSASGGGTAVSNNRGSVATGGSEARAEQRKQMRNERRHDRGDRDRGGNAASTYGSGTVYTDRHRATGGVTTGASASGRDRQSASSSVDAYGSTTRHGSEAEVWGDSQARSRR